MRNNNKQNNDLSQCSFRFRIWIYFCCILINIAAVTFLVVSRLIIIILWPLVRLSLILEYLNLKLRKKLLEERLKNLSEVERDSRT
jgi:Na+-translocating ferredoxin:NAD+ oxidoreductase RnfD subunit